ncbi:MAG: pyridoxal phosphate-dependent aminotransferase, partial [Candidatus Methylomirabilales bacterium]
LSGRARGINPSPTMAITALANRMKAEGIDVIGFGAGEPDFDTPDHVKAAAIEAIQAGFSKYTAAAGIIELREAVTVKLKRDNGLDYAPDAVVITSGSKQALYNLAMILFDKGDEVVVPSPYWVSYPEQIRLAEATPVFAPTSEARGFSLTRKDVERVLSSRTKALIVNSPSNPTGAVIRSDQLQRIAALAVERNFFLISDEAYDALTYDGIPHVSIASMGEEVKARTIVVGSASKTYAMTGWRLGYAAGPKEIIKVMADLQSQSTSNTTSITQKAAIAALVGPQECVATMRNEFDRRRRVMVDRLRAMPGITCEMPRGAFYAFPNISHYNGRRTPAGKQIQGSSDFIGFLLEAARIAAIPGVDFGSDRHIRLSYALSMPLLEEGMARMAAALKTIP